ncbi:MAG: glycosyltransferase family 4 protein [Planctomycetes bacterium]|nr:glycosyltransferase family 4 protein [Planctomycetota bacterium]
MVDHVSTNEMPRPLMVAHGWPRECYANGVVSYTAEIVAGMRRIGAQPRVAVFRIAEGAREDFVSQIPPVLAGYGRAARIAFSACRKMWPGLEVPSLECASLLRKIRCLAVEAPVDICEMEEAHARAGFLVGRSPIPIIVRLHGPWFLSGASRGDKQDGAFRRRVKQEGVSITKADGVTAPSRAVLEAVRSFYGFGLEEAEVIPNPVSPAAEQDRWKLCTCEPDEILFVGRFDRTKGADIAVEAIRRLRSVRPHCRLTFVGPDDGLITDEGAPTHFEDFINARMPGATWDGAVQYMGYQPHNLLAHLRRRAMVTMVPSRYETFGTTVVEAMSLGCPVVAADVGGIPEIIQHERNGLLCRPDDVDDLVEKMLVLFRNPEFAARLGAQAAIDADEDYHPDRIARQTLAFYRRVIGSTAGRKRIGIS